MLKQSSHFACVTGINEDLIYFRFISETFSSESDNSVDAFESYVKENKEIHLTHYPWYCMPTLQQVLMRRK
jgi:hypothetical protein